MKNKLQLYSIMSLDTNHIDEICEDIRMQYEKGVTTCALFNMTLVPEGNPPVDKVSAMCQAYDRFKEKLDAMGVPSGVLVQASIGHGWVLNEKFPFQSYTNLTDGKELTVVCPYDEGFQGYIYNVMKTITSHNPYCIMVDDDFRLMGRAGRGCGCPLHMKKFNEMAGTDLSREELWSIVSQESAEAKKYGDIFVETQKESVLETAKIMRAGIDSVNPKMPGSFCCVGNNAEFAYEIAAVLAGEGNPIVVRINNGNYTPAGARFFSGAFYRAAAQIAKLKDKVDVILAETDTCPQNRYSTGAMSLHTHFTGTILEGAKGAKHWITRLQAFEPRSGIGYRRILGKYCGFYEALAQLEPELTWRGFRIPVSKEPDYAFWKDGSAINAWGLCVLERFGLPMYFSAENGGIACLEGNVDEALSDEEIIKMLSGPVFLASDAAQNLIKRGFGEYIGVDVKEWTGKQPSHEQLLVNGNTTKIQMQVKELIPLSDKVMEDSIVYHAVGNEKKEKLFPGTVIYENQLGGKIFTFSGTPKAKFNILEAFSFLNYSRKQQIIRMMTQTGEMPVYYPGDEEIYLRAADMQDGGLFAAVFNIGLDPIESLELVISHKVAEIEMLTADGTKVPVAFKEEDGRYILETCCNTLEPVILFIRRLPEE